MTDPVKDKLKRLEVLAHLDENVFHATVGAAVDAYIEEHSVNWTP
ncbi:MAG: sulfate anion transporter [Pseudomonas sp.]|nr:sulfate anion transporter [Pseudomonas sp.]